jgi:hypothetical protein
MSPTSATFLKESINHRILTNSESTNIFRPTYEDTNYYEKSKILMTYTLELIIECTKP